MRHGCLPVDPGLLRIVRRHHFPAGSVGSTGAVALRSATAVGSTPTVVTDGTALPALDRSGVVFPHNTYDNTVVPDCVAASVANVIRFNSALSGITKPLLPFNSGKPVDWFAYLLGIIKNEAPSTDPALNPTYAAAMDKAGGISPLTVLFALQAPGLNIGPQIVTGTFGLIEPVVEQIAAANCSPLGALMACVNLNANDVAAEAQGEVWDTQASDPGLPWLEGHALTMLDYGGLNPTSLVRFETWGFAKQATWRWVQSRMTNVFALQTPQIVTPGWYSSLPPGLDIPL